MGEGAQGNGDREVVRTAETVRVPSGIPSLDEMIND